MNRFKWFALDIVEPAQTNDVKIVVNNNTFVKSEGAKPRCCGLCAQPKAVCDDGWQDRDEWNTGKQREQHTIRAVVGGIGVVIAVASMCVLGLLVLSLDGWSAN